MKKIFLLFSALFIFTSLSFSQDEMKKWMDYMTPADAHKNMAKQVGTWTFESTMWMDPAAPPQKSTGTATIEMILGGRYQQMKVSGNMMGMPFEGISITGYDNGKKVYTNVWYDNFGTGTLTTEGNFDDAGKILTVTGKMYDPMTGGETKVKEVLEIVNDNTMKMYMYDYRNGSETKNMEIVYTRK